MASSVLCLGVGAQTFLPKEICRKKINKIPEFCVTLARKIYTRIVSYNFSKTYPNCISEMPEFYIMIARKIFSGIFGVRALPAPVSCAYGTLIFYYFICMCQY